MSNRTTLSTTTIILLIVCLAIGAGGGYVITNNALQPSARSLLEQYSEISIENDKILIELNELEELYLKLIPEYSSLTATLVDLNSSITMMREQLLNLDRSTDHSSSNTTQLGVGISFSDSQWSEPDFIQTLQEMGITWVRVNLRIYNDMRDLDFISFLKMFWDSDINVLGVVDQKTLGWNITNWRQIADPSDWRKTLHQLFERGSIYLSALECWNEPDLPKFHNGFMNGTPENYFEILKATYQVAKAYNPNLPVIAGGLATLRDSNQTSGNYYGGYLLKEIIKLGSDNYCDGYSFHCYDWFLDGVDGINDAESLYMKGKEIIGRKKELWCSEMGYQTDDPIEIMKVETWMHQFININCPKVFYKNYTVAANSIN